MNWGRISSASYTTSDGTSSYAPSVNSLIGRIGLAVGRDQKNSSYYFKTSLDREFNANSSITMLDVGSTGVTLSQDLKDTWLEFELGWTGTLDRNVDSYVELSRTTGGILNTPWQINVGIRKSF